LFIFRVGKLNEGGRDPIPASVGTAQPGGGKQPRQRQI